MSTLTKVALGLMGKMRPLPAIGDGPQTIVLPTPETTGGMPLLDALRQRQSGREFLQEVLPPQLLSNLLWAGFGINRKSDTGRTAPPR